MNNEKAAKKHKIITEIDEMGRKKFTLQEEEQSAEEKHEQFMNTGRNLSTLIGRDEGINAKQYIGRTGGIKAKNNVNKILPFKCDVCKVSYSCDSALLDHLNSASHNRKIGMNMKVKAVSVQTVADKILRIQKERKQSKNKIKMEKLAAKYEEGVYPQPAKQEEDKTPEKQIQNEAKEEALEVKEQHDQEEQQDESQKLDPEEQMMMQMGLPTNFGSKKRKY